MIRPIGITFSVGMSVVFLAILTGCGKTPSDVQGDAKAPAAQKRVVAGTADAPIDVAAAMDTVSHFLDAVRRGGDTGGAHSLLTQEACGVLQRLGRTVQPIGSPDATFTVTRSEPVEDHPNTALVHSTWSEPAGDGTTESYQVVWALHLENNAWRISGLAMELNPEQPPMIVDFEDHAQMANLFRSQPEAVQNNSESPESSAREDSMSQAPQAAGKF